MPSPTRSDLPDTLSSSDEDTTNDEQTLTKKRKKALTEVCKLKGKRRKSANPLRPYIKFARLYTRSQDIEPNWFMVLDKGIAYDSGNFGNLTPLQYLKKNKRYMKIYRDMQAEIPCFNVEFDFLRGNPSLTEAVSKAMIAGSGAARSEDISSLKDAVLIYTGRHEVGEVLTPPIKHGSSKAGTRGHHHIQLSRKICPVSLLADFDREPEIFRKKLLRGKVPIRAKDWPSFFWPNNDYDQEHLFDGLLRNPVLILVFKHIFTSPSSAMIEEPQHARAKASQAKLNGMKTVTYGSIAYVCVLYRFCISDVPDWRIKDQVYDWHRLYDEVVAIMTTAEEEDPDWLKDLLEFWNSQVFGTDSSIEDDSDAAQGQSSSMAILKQQRLAKQATLTQREPSSDDEERVVPPPPQSEVDEDSNDNQLRSPQLQPREQNRNNLQPRGQHADQPQRHHLSHPGLSQPTQPPPPNPTLDSYPPAGYLSTPYNTHRQFSDMSPRSQWVFHNPGAPLYTPNHGDQSMYHRAGPSNFVHAPGFSGLGPPMNNINIMDQAGHSMPRNRHGPNASETRHSG